MKTKNANNVDDTLDDGAYDDTFGYDEADVSPADWEAMEREEHVLLALGGDSEAAALINAHREAFPEAASRLGNPGHHALDTIIRQIADSDAHIAEALRRQCSAYRAELLAGSSDCLLAMAVDTVLVTWVYQHLVFQQAAGRTSTSPMQQQKAQREAQRSHEGALRCLELVKNKLQPAKVVLRFRRRKPKA